MRSLMLPIILAGMFTASAFAQSVPVAELQVTTPAAAVTIRQQIITTISGASAITPPLQTFHDGYGSTGAPGDVVSYYGRTPASVAWWGWKWSFGGPPDNMVSRTHFATFTGSTCLLIYNGGHGQGFFTPIEGFSFASPVETRDFIRRVVNELGCDVILNSEPLGGENVYFRVGVGLTGAPDAHGALGTLPAHQPPQGTPLRYFVEPAIGSLNYALSLRSYDKVIVAGLSHGGWLTTLLAAIEPRITHSYAVAGSVPLAYRDGVEGDWEQLTAIRQLGIDYPDLYLMGTIDAEGNPTRKVRLLYNGLDECCFKALPVLAFAAWLKPYAVANGFGSLRIFIDPAQTTHAIHSSHAAAILADFD